MELDHDACYRALCARDPRFDGVFFVGVRSTRIYCRPICPARTPLARNVRFYPSAAAAQAAGLRPCLRCRPETTPGLPAWQGTAATVSRALALIDRGALDGAPVDALADRLGVGARQLRRLFRQHLGASPAEVAHTRRILFAKQLVTETALPMAEVAEAAGFGSLRRFNAAFRTLYRRPPTALRRAGCEPAGEVTLTLSYRPPHDLHNLLRFLAARAIAGVEQVSLGHYARTIRVGPHAGLIRVRHHPTRPALLATIRLPNLAGLPAIAGRIRAIFDLAANPAAIAAHLGNDPDLAPRIAARPGLRVPGAWDGFELAVRGILGQQITVAAATRLATRLVGAYGTPLPPDLATPGLTHLFPAAERLAAADDIAATIGMPAARGAAIAGLARAAAADPTLFDPGQDPAAAIARLTALPGIGAWTAHYIALRALRDPDAFPAADVALMRALVTPAGRPTEAALRARAEAWRPWRAYAALHLWTDDASATTLAA